MFIMYIRIWRISRFTRLEKFYLPYLYRKEEQESTDKVQLKKIDLLSIWNKCWVNNIY